MHRLPTEHPSTDQSLPALAARLRADAWVITGHWLEATADLPSRAALTPPGGCTEDLVLVGQMPAFLAALAHHLEATDPATAESRVPADSPLREAARAHASERAAAGFRQRDMLAEFVRLRRVLWEHLGTGAVSEDIQRRLNQLLDAVLVETADQFFLELTDDLTNRAERDELTGAYNRAAFYDRLQAELNRARRLGYAVTVALIDLDGFKLVNDTLGHLTGDALLRRIGVLLAAHTREADIVGRLGGDEFAVALVGAGADGAQDLAQRLRVHLAPARRQLALPGAFGLSIGSATWPRDGEGIDHLLFHADQAMYAAKYARKGLTRDDGPPLADSGSEPVVDPLRVVVVDDDPGVRMLCRTTLEAEGWKVVEAPTIADGRGALEVARADAVLLDVNLPDGSGWELARELASGPHADTPIVMMTGDTRGSYLVRAVQRGVADYLPKPFTPADVSGVLHRVIEQFAEVS